MEASPANLGVYAIPGDPEALQAFATQLLDTAAALESARFNLPAIGLPETWKGPASAANLNVLQLIQVNGSTLQDKLHGGGTDVSSFANTLHQLQTYATQLAGLIGDARETVSELETTVATANQELKNAEANLASTAHDPGLNAQAKTEHSSAQSTAIFWQQQLDDANANLSALWKKAGANWQEYQDAAEKLCYQLDPGNLLQQALHQAGSVAGYAEKHGKAIIEDVTNGIATASQDLVTALTPLLLLPPPADAAVSAAIAALSAINLTASVAEVGEQAAFEGRKMTVQQAVDDLESIGLDELETKIPDGDQIFTDLKPALGNFLGAAAEDGLGYENPNVLSLVSKLQLNTPNGALNAAAQKQKQQQQQEVNSFIHMGSSHSYLDE